MREKREDEIPENEIMIPPAKKVVVMSAYH